MLFYTVGQSRIFLTMLYAGMCIGLYSTIDCAARKLFEAGRLMTFFMDILLGAAAVLILIPALLISSDGELRLYALMGALCGYLLFGATLGRVLPRIAEFLLRPLRRFLRALFRSRLLRRLFK